MKSNMRRPSAALFYSNTFRIPLIVIMMISVVLLAYFTGGATKSYTHLIYIPILLSAYFWTIKGGTITALFSGALIGPILPLNVAEGIMQTEGNWIIRLVVLTIVGFVAGYMFHKVNKLNEQAKERDFINPLTGTYNTNKLINDLEKKMNEGEKFAILSIKLTNIEQMIKYIEHGFANQVLNNLINEFSSIYGKDSFYTSGHDEIDVVVPSSYGYIDECKRIIERHSTALVVNQFTFRILMKIGIYEYCGENETPISVYNKARIAYEQGDNQESGIYFYDKRFDLSRKEFLEISSSLLESIDKNELYLVYQPKINIADNSISGVEVLTRWDRKGRKPVGPDVFIKLAEDIGFINEISEFVLKNSFYQITDWNKKGMGLDFSINFTVNELLENHVVEWERKVMEDENIIGSKLEIEITERVLSHDDDKIKERIDELRANGIKISIDDFGTGVNSFFRVAQFPYDQIKIDKYFIDHIEVFEIREMVKTIIDYAHKFDKEIVAEGVETEAQLNILRELNCDIIQGYYYSKPLRPDEFEKYYSNFHEEIDKRYRA